MCLYVSDDEFTFLEIQYLVEVDFPFFCWCWP